MVWMKSKQLPLEGVADNFETKSVQTTNPLMFCAYLLYTQFNNSVLFHFKPKSVGSELTGVLCELSWTYEAKLCNTVQQRLPLGSFKLDYLIYRWGMSMQLVHFILGLNDKIY